MSDRPLQSIQDTLRLPLYSTENIHDSADDSLILDQMIMNYIPGFAVDPSSETKEAFLTKRPGISVIASSDWMTGKVADATQCTILDAIAITAVYDVFVAAVFDESNDTIYIIQIRPAANTSTLIGSFTPTATVDDFVFLSEYSQSNAGSLYPAVAVSWTNKALTASKGYYARSSGGVFSAASLTEITDTGFPPKQTPARITIGKFIFLNGTIYIATLDGRIYNSVAATNDITDWTDSNSQIGVRLVNAYPDQCMGIERYKNNIVALGRNSIEFFNDVGSSPSPLAKMDQAFIKFGVKSPRLVKNISDVLYWVAYGDDGITGLWQLTGYTPTKLSTSAIDRFFIGTAATGDPSYYNLQAVGVNGKQMLIINQTPNPTSYPIAAWSSSYPTASGSSNDTYALTTTSNKLNDLVHNNLVYNIVDKTWWGLNVLNTVTCYLMCAGTEFGTPATQSNANAYSQILLYNFWGGGGTNPVTRYVHQWDYSGHIADAVGDSSSTFYPEKPVTSLVQLNTSWFMNEKRKRVNKFKVIGNFPRQRYQTSNVYSMYLFYLKDQDSIAASSGLLDNIHYRGFNFPNSVYRYYLNNLGMGRAWSFCLVEKSKQPITLRAIELDIQQGSH